MNEGFFRHLPMDSLSEETLHLQQQLELMKKQLLKKERKLKRLERKIIVRKHVRQKIDECNKEFEKHEHSGSDSELHNRNKRVSVRDPKKVTITSGFCSTPHIGESSDNEVCKEPMQTFYCCCEKGKNPVKRQHVIHLNLKECYQASCSEFQNFISYCRIGQENYVLPKLEPYILSPMSFTYITLYNILWQEAKHFMGRQVTINVNLALPYLKELILDKDLLCAVEWLCNSIFVEFYLSDETSCKKLRMFKRIPPKYIEQNNPQCFIHYSDASELPLSSLNSSSVKMECSVENIEFSEVSSSDIESSQSKSRVDSQPSVTSRYSLRASKRPISATPEVKIMEKWNVRQMSGKAEKGKEAKIIQSAFKSLLKISFNFSVCDFALPDENEYLHLKLQRRKQEPVSANKPLATSSNDETENNVSVQNNHFSNDSSDLYHSLFNMQSGIPLPTIMKCNNKSQRDNYEMKPKDNAHQTVKFLTCLKCSSSEQIKKIHIWTRRNDDDILYYIVVSLESTLQFWMLDKSLDLWIQKQTYVPDGVSTIEDFWLCSDVSSIPCLVLEQKKEGLFLKVVFYNVKRSSLHCCIIISVNDKSSIIVTQLQSLSCATALTEKDGLHAVYKHSFHKVNRKWKTETLMLGKVENKVLSLTKVNSTKSVMLALTSTDLYMWDHDDITLLKVLHVNPGMGINLWALAISGYIITLNVLECAGGKSYYLYALNPVNGCYKLFYELDVPGINYIWPNFCHNCGIQLCLAIVQEGSTLVFNILRKKVVASFQMKPTNFAICACKNVMFCSSAECARCVHIHCADSRSFHDFKPWTCV